MAPCIATVSPSVLHSTPLTQQSVCFSAREGAIATNGNPNADEQCGVQEPPGRVGKAGAKED